VPGILKMFSKIKNLKLIKIREVSSLMCCYEKPISLHGQKKGIIHEHIKKK